MTRHNFRWDSFVFGLFFLAVVGNWVAWKQDAFTIAEMGVVAPIILIVIGVGGVLASLRRPRADESPTVADESRTVADESPSVTDESPSVSEPEEETS